MFKKAILFMMILGFGYLLPASNLYASPVLGYVNPGYGDVDPGYQAAHPGYHYDLGSSTTGLALYTFENVAPGAGENMVALSLGFESDVFDLALTAPVAGSANPGWSLDWVGFGPDKAILSWNSPGLPEGEQLSFLVDYTLQDDAISLDDAGAWDEASSTPGYWQQGFGVRYGNGMIGGGSTAPVPEPGTLLLLGVSMVSFAAYGRKRLNRSK